jgi:hypothetical protein
MEENKKCRSRFSSVTISLSAENIKSANDYFPRNSLTLNPKTGQLLEVDFVECFFTWLAGFINASYDYE